VHFKLAAWLKLMACFAHWLDNRAKLKACEKQKDTPQLILQIWRSPADRQQLGADYAICIHSATMTGAATARLQRLPTPSCDVDNNAPPPLIAMRADRDTHCYYGCFTHAPEGLTFDVRGGPLAGRPLDGGVRCQAMHEDAPLQR
jgi:hypothetical protein